MTVQGGQLRVLHVVASTDPRGAESAAVGLHHHLVDLGCAGEIVALAPGQVGGLGVQSLGPTRFSGQTIRSLRAATSDCDVVVAHGSSTLPAVALATFGDSKPFVYRSIGDPRSWITTPTRRARVRLEAGRAAGVVALWRESAVFWHEAIGVPAERIEVIPNGVDQARFPYAGEDERRRARKSLGVPTGSRVVLCMGSLSIEKRVDLAIRAVASLDEAPLLLVVGDGPERAFLERLASDLLGDRAVFAGPTHDPWEALAACDVVAIPSDTEGHPAVAIEAGLAGRPVVASRVGGVPEVVLDGLTGALVEPGDHAELAAVLARFLSHPEFSGRAAREQCVAAFDLAAIASRWLRFLQRSIT